MVINISSSNRLSKISKNMVIRKVENLHGLDVRVLGSSTFVGFIIVTKEYKNFVAGYVGRCTHDEYKSGCLSRYSMDDFIAAEEPPEWDELRPGKGHCPTCGADDCTVVQDPNTRRWHVICHHQGCPHRYDKYPGMGYDRESQCYR